MGIILMVVLIIEGVLITLILSNIMELLIKTCADVSFVKDLFSKEKADEMVDRLVREGYVTTGKKVQ